MTLGLATLTPSRTRSLHAGTYGIDNIRILFPTHGPLPIITTFIKHRTDWVTEHVLNEVHSHSRIKSIHADITDDKAHALGYVQGQ